MVSTKIPGTHSLEMIVRGKMCNTFQRVHINLVRENNKRHTDIPIIHVLNFELKPTNTSRLINILRPQLKCVVLVDLIHSFNHSLVW